MPNARIFYFTYDHNKPTGGQKHTYRHVDILNKHGFDAVALHMKDGFRLTWFDNDTRVAYASRVMTEFNVETDIVVLPEDLGLDMFKFPGRKVIFNKNLYYGFQAFNFTKVEYPYLSPDVIAVLAVSEHNQRHLQYAYPHLDVLRVYCEIKADVFRFASALTKKPQVATIRKGDGRLATIFHMLDSRSAAGLNRAREFEWVFLGELSERGVARVLAESPIFVFASIEEGLARMPLEAMASGCLTVGYGHGPLREVLPQGCQFACGEEIELVRFLETAMAAYPTAFDAFNTQINEGVGLASAFSLERSERSVVDAWERILGSQRGSLTQ